MFLLAADINPWTVLLADYREREVSPPIDIKLLKEFYRIWNFQTTRLETLKPEEPAYQTGKPDAIFFSP